MRFARLFPMIVAVLLVSACGGELMEPSAMDNGTNTMGSGGFSSTSESDTTSTQTQGTNMLGSGG